MKNAGFFSASKMMRILRNFVLIPLLSILLLVVFDVLVMESYWGETPLLELPEGGKITLAKNAWGEGQIQHKDKGSTWKVKLVSFSDLNEKIESIEWKDGQIEIVIGRYRNTKKSQRFKYNPTSHITQPVP